MTSCNTDLPRCPPLDPTNLTAINARLQGIRIADLIRQQTAVVMMREGRIVDRGAPADLVARYGRRTLEEVFLDIARGRGAGQPGHSGAAGAAGATGDSVGR